VTVLNGQPVTLQYTRNTTRPDFVFFAADLAGNPGDMFITDSAFARSGTVNWTPASLTGSGGNNPPPGPGNIRGPIQITFHKVGPAFLTIGPDFVKGALSAAEFVYGSFDASTNLPVIYPDGTSIAQLEAQALMQMIPGTLPNGRVGVAYNQPLSGLGGQPCSGAQPYTFSLAPGSPALPPGLNFAGSAIVGTPAAGSAGTYDFTIAMVDCGSREADFEVSITIAP
jgi:hypothetical protein